jgi:hypothetical protein
MRALAASNTEEFSSVSIRRQASRWHARRLVSSLAGDHRRGNRLGTASDLSSHPFASNSHFNRHSSPLALTNCWRRKRDFHLPAPLTAI